MEKNKTRRPITFLRRISQILCFFLIVFGAFLGIKKQNLSFLPFIEAPLEYKEQLKSEEKATIILGPAYPQAFDTYLPIKSCRFLRQVGIFRACFMHFVSESISWLSPLRLLLPHVLLFLILVILLGRFWCGWVCPLGFIQDTLNAVRKLFKLRRFFFSEKFRKTLRNLSYLLFVSIIILSLLSAIPKLSWSVRKQIYLSVCQMCPARFIFPYIGNWPIKHSFFPFGYGIFTTISIIFLLFLMVSLFIKRSWCRICPSGLLLSFFNKGSFLTKRKEILKCTRCGICLEVCPLDNKEVYLEKKKKNIEFASCIHCFGCIDFCPEQRCLEVHFLGNPIFRSKFKK